MRNLLRSMAKYLLVGVGQGISAIIVAANGPDAISSALKETSAAFLGYRIIQDCDGSINSKQTNCNGGLKSILAFHAP